ncbi:MAG: quinoprotein glucose dehydrogenase, partial [Sphingomonas bacterium]|nr:quinoprotein glucose dehydrogenase [Sphingomonas bacterium]
MRNRVALALGASLLLAPAHAQTGPAALDPADWPRYTRDLAGTRHSPLAQINTGNVARLATAWTFRVRPEGGGSIVSSATPIAIDGVLYMPIGNAIV